MIYLAYDIQNSFLKYFEEKGHKIVSGSSVIPKEDLTLLFTNAGMNQFKDYFTGFSVPSYGCVTTAQRCIRAGGKHNDLSQVGFTARHLTHFTMLGNFSFSSYFKKEAIFYAWDYLTNVIKIDKDLLWITIYETDEEAFSIWNNDIGVDYKRIFRLGEKDNFWQMGDTGPCGPCSEIYFDKGVLNELDESSFPGDDKSIRFMEIWNLVFMQYQRQSDGSLVPLKKVGIDTGMGLERLASILQKKDSVYQTDLFMPLIKYIEKESHKKYEGSLISAFNILCDHLRTSALLIYEGIVPSNEGRGYVLRKIIRRALLFSKKLSNKNDFFSSLVSFFLFDQKDLYEDLIVKKDIIQSIILEESLKFFDNLDFGIELFNSFLKKQTEKNIFSGEDAFVLYDTYGFPLEITTVLANEAKMEVDELKYEECMKQQKERSRNNQKFNSFEVTINSDFITNFLGYDNNSCYGIIKEIYIDGKSFNNSIINKECILVLDQTVFYPTGGGQIHDVGNIIFNNKNIIVLDSKKYGNSIGITVNSDVVLSINNKVNQLINEKKRTESQKHHSAVHLLHKFISIYFKDNSIYQHGSYVCDEYFTLDVVMKDIVNYEDKKNLELCINNIISEGHDILVKNMSFDDAIKIGATAQFTEKYNKDNVRVIDIDGVTVDLCGGCHAKNTKDLGFFILKEVVSAGAGIRRFVGMVGAAAFIYIKQLEEAVNKVKLVYSCSVEKIDYEVVKRIELLKNKDKEINLLKIELAYSFAQRIIKTFIKEKVVFQDIPVNLKGYEKYIAERLKDIFPLCVLYCQKERDIFLTYIIFASWLTDLQKNEFNDILKNKFNFSGKCRDNFCQGTINVINRDDLFI
jgi:alanyl-tRNA synthetase